MAIWVHDWAIDPVWLGLYPTQPKMAARMPMWLSAPLQALKAFAPLLRGVLCGLRGALSGSTGVSEGLRGDLGTLGVS